MNKKNIVQLIISGILLVVLLILVISAVNAKKTKRQVIDKIGKPAVSKEAQDLENPPKSLFEELEDQARGITLTRDPFIFAPMAVSKDTNSAFHLNGILWDKQEPIALINGSFIKKGESIDSAIVVEIRQDRVILNDGTHSFEVKLE